MVTCMLFFTNAQRHLEKPGPGANPVTEIVESIVESICQ